MLKNLEIFSGGAASSELLNTIRQSTQPLVYTFSWGREDREDFPQLRVEIFELSMGAEDLSRIKSSPSPPP